MLQEIEQWAYLVAFMLKTIPTAEHFGEPREQVISRYERQSTTVLSVVNDPAEKPLFQGDNGRLMTATLITAIRRFEGSFKEGPIHGDCPKSKDGICRTEADGKPRSFCQMQIQPGPTGIVLTEDYWRFADDGETGISGEDLDGDDALCVRVGLHMVRASFRNTGDLGEYTGEGRNGKKAGHRLSLAKWFFTTFKPETRAWLSIQ